jgi:HD-GYP domain-containing protein (c-di-GMP phosphodiesterase class II)
MKDSKSDRQAVITASRLSETDASTVDLFGAPASQGTHVQLDSLVIPLGCTLRISAVNVGEGESMAVCDDITEQSDAHSAIAESRVRLEKLVYDLAGAIVGIANTRDPYTAGSEVGVAYLARTIAYEMRLPQQVIEEASMAGLLHDIGTLGVPEEVLANPGKLSDEEFEQMKKHPVYGSKILEGVEFPGPVAEIVLQHHERLDGSGYPRGLTGDKILIGARILAVADVADAMMASRPYREALGVHEVIDELEGHSALYDPDVVAACIQVLRRANATE